MPQDASSPEPSLMKGVQAGQRMLPHISKVHPLQQCCINIRV